MYSTELFELKNKLKGLKKPIEPLSSKHIDEESLVNFIKSSGYNDGVDKALEVVLEFIESKNLYLKHKNT